MCYVLVRYLKFFLYPWLSALRALFSQVHSVWSSVPCQQWRSWQAVSQNKKQGLACKNSIFNYGVYGLARFRKIEKEDGTDWYFRRNTQTLQFCRYWSNWKKGMKYSVTGDDLSNKFELEELDLGLDITPGSLFQLRLVGEAPSSQFPTSEHCLALQ